MSLVVLMAPKPITDVCDGSRMEKGHGDSLLWFSLASFKQSVKLDSWKRTPYTRCMRL